MLLGVKDPQGSKYPNNEALGPPDHEYYSIGKPHHLSPWTLRGYSGSWNCASSARQSRMLQCWGLYGGLLKQRCHWICQRSMESVRERRGPERGAGRGMIHGKGDRHTMPPKTSPSPSLDRTRFSQMPEP